jgi:outer membrane protein TolC
MLELGGSYNHMNAPLTMDLNPIRDVIVNVQAKNMVQFQNIGSILAGGGALTAAQQAAVFNASKTGLYSQIPSFVEELKRQDNKYLTFTAVQPLFLGGKLFAAQSAASNELEATKIEAKRVEDDVIKETSEAYLGCVLLNDVIRVRESVLEAVKKHRDRASKLFEEGMIPKYQLLRAEVAVAEAEQNLTDEKARLDVALTVLKEYTGLNAADSVIVAETLTFHPANYTLEELKEKAMTDQPYLQYIDKKKEEAGANYAAARSNFLPSVFAFGQYETLPEYLSALEPRWVVGVKFQYNLFNGFKDYEKLESADHLESEVAFMKKDTEQKISIWLNKAYQQKNAAKSRYEKLGVNVDLATENLRAAEKRFEAGSGITLEVIDATVLLEKTTVDRCNALYDYDKNVLDMLTAAGHTQQFIEFWNQEVKQ